jgi:hypothetical protein
MGSIISVPESAQSTWLDRAEEGKSAGPARDLRADRIGLSCPFLVTFFDKKKSNRAEKYKDTIQVLLWIEANKFHPSRFLVKTQLPN